MSKKLSIEQINALQTCVEKLEVENQLLRHLESRYRQIFENAPISMMLLNQRGYVSSMNAAAQDLYGLTVEQFNQNACPIFENLQLVENGTLSYMQRALAGESVIQPRSFYDSSRDSDSGKFHYGRGHYAPIRDAAGLVDEIIEIAPKCDDFFKLQAQLLEETEQARAVEQARNEVLQQRDSMLTTVAEATKVLLNSSITDLSRVIPAALRVLGEGLGCDRVNVLENFGQSATQVPEYTKVIFGWAKPDMILHFAHLNTTQIDCKGLEGFTKQCLQNNGFGGLVDDWPEPLRHAFKAVDIQSSYSVPIWLGERFWGIATFDYCHEAKQVSPAEMAILRTAAACIGGAIQRDRSQKAILQTEQAQVAKLTKTNQALKKNLDRLAAESDLDAFLGHVLTAISNQLNIQTVWFYFYNSTDQTLLLHRWVERGEVQPPENFSQLGPMANPISVANLPIWEHLQQTKSPFVTTPNNGEQAELFMFPETQDWQLHWIKQNNVQSGINILLMLGETPIGLLGLLSAQRREYTSEELALLQALTHQATLAIQLTRLADEAQQSTLYEERSRLAGEIHDTLAQTFTGISVQLELAQYLIGQSAQDGEFAEVTSTLEHIASLAQTGLAEARRSVWSLYPASEDYNNLAEPLANFMIALAKGKNLNTQVKLKGDPYPLNYFVGKNLVRIGQEAITNTFRHAHATEIWVDLTYSSHQVSLRVSDNGCGFILQKQAEGFGLVSISERVDRIGGQLQITTQLGQGTEIFVQVPL